MIPVIDSTKIDKSKIDLAGVDSGEKMLVKEWEGSASDLGGNKTDDKANIASCLARIVVEFVMGRICLNSSTPITEASVLR